jgi:hypothetical protein
MGKPLRSGEGAVIAELDFSLIDNSAGEAGIACWTKLEITPPSISNHSRYGTVRPPACGEKSKNNDAARVLSTMARRYAGLGENDLPPGECPLHQ